MWNLFLRSQDVYKRQIYLSTTDENIEKQTESIIDDLILRYFKKQSKEVKLVIEKFENQYIELTNTFRNNIKGIEEMCIRDRRNTMQNRNARIGRLKVIMIRFPEASRKNYFMRLSFR